MKIKTLLLGTVAAAGMSTAAMAADPAVLTSLDVCDALGISGLTISSDSNCLQISGGVEYQFDWGDYDGSVASPGWLYAPADNGGVAPLTQDWESQVDAWLKFVGTADSDFGPVKAVIKLGFDEDYTVTNEGAAVAGTGNGLTVDEAYVTAGDSTVLMAGKKGSIAKLGHDKAYNYLGLRHDDFGLTGVDTGGHVIQLTSDLGNGVDVGIGLEDLGGNGSLIGTLGYAGDTLAAHITFGADDILTGAVASWAVHAGAEVTIDMFKFLVAANFDSASVWNALVAAQATFDMFTLAASAYANSTNGVEFAGSIAADVTDTVTVKLGGQWDDHNTTTANDEQWKVAAQVSAAVTETVTLVAELGVDGKTAAGAPQSVAFGSAEVKWAPGGDFTSSVKGWGNAEGAYKVTFKAAKKFQ